MTIFNASDNRLLKLTFADKDVIHLFPGESLTFPSYFGTPTSEHI